MSVFLPSNRQLSGHRAENAFYQNLVDAFIIDILNLEFPCFCIISVPMVGQIFVFDKNMDFYENRFKSISSSVLLHQFSQNLRNCVDSHLLYRVFDQIQTLESGKHACLTALEQGFQKWSNRRNAFISALKLCEKTWNSSILWKLGPRNSHLGSSYICHIFAVRVFFTNVTLACQWEGKHRKTGATRARPAIVTWQGLLLKSDVTYCLRPVGVWLCSGWMGDFNTALALVLTRLHPQGKGGPQVFLCGRRLKSSRKSENVPTKQIKKSIIFERSVVYCSWTFCSKKCVFDTSWLWYTQ